MLNDRFLTGAVLKEILTCPLKGGIMVVAIASGKGGTGKTTVATSLAAAGWMAGRTVQLLDGDVEAPNCHLLLRPTIRQSEPVLVPTPEIDRSQCDGCGICGGVCAFGALVCLNGQVVVFNELCHSGGGCLNICPRGAILEKGREIGFIEEGDVAGMPFGQGRLNVGEPRAVPVIAELKKRKAANGIVLIDAPPGTSCPVVEAIKDSDFVCLVTEPTPFGLHDLKQAVGTVRRLGLAMGVVINRAGIGDERVRTYCEQEHIPILMELPNDRRIAEAYSRGQLIVEALPVYRADFEALLERIEQYVGERHT